MQANGLANGAEGRTTTDWNTIDWRKVDRSVNNLRRRIFRASKEGDHRKVASLQKLMLRSRANTLHSVRRVTQTNKGKNTPGVDKLVVKTPKARNRLVDYISSYQPWKVKPARRVYIPKSNGKLRPLGIPTVTDRVMQAIVKNALEPYWEAHFERTSYGFRPGRGCHDAIARIFNIALPNHRRKWVLDADVEGAFDNICQYHLLETIGSFPARELIRQWLKAGYMEENSWYETETGAPQGGVISPLLMNIALHGMEEALGIRHTKEGKTVGSRALVRYADDWVVFCESREDAEAACEQTREWLQKRGLRLSEEKTRIVHLSEGFDFLGFNIRHYPAPKTSRSGRKLLIKPSNDSVRKLKGRLRQEWKSLKGCSIHKVIRRLNPILRGWTNYFRIGVSKRAFKSIDNWMFMRSVHYVNHAHPNKGWQWRQSKYWGMLNPKRDDRWVFGDKLSGIYLLKMSWIPIERHVLVKGAASPDDPELKGYWRKRQMRDAEELPPRHRRLALTQKGACSHCGASLLNGEELNAHHLKGRTSPDSDEPHNLRLVHLYCHHQLHPRVGPRM